MDNFILGFSRRCNGNMSLSYGDTSGALRAREKFLGGLGIDHRDLVCAKQTHSCNVRCVKEEDRGRGALSYGTCLPDTDSLVTDEKNLPLAVFTADCLPVFLYDPGTPAIGMAHAGWRSSKEGIAVRTLGLMGEKFNSRPENLRVSFGPAIRECCYEVGGELRHNFKDYIVEREKRYYLDLVKLILEQLLAAGVKQDHVRDHAVCTSCRNNEFFSFRREGTSCGRTMSVIMLK